MDTGEQLTRWTARAALALYAVALALRWNTSARRTWRATARMVWTAGWLIFLLHVFCAFQFVHHWSHADAYEETARRAAEAIGWEWGGGLYANYAFALVWMADVVWWWRGLEVYEGRPRVVAWSVQGFLAFMAFNAAVVFADGVMRWVSLGVCVCLLLLASWSALRGRGS